VVSAADPPRPFISVFYTGAATFLSSSSTFMLTRLNETRSKPAATQKNVVAPGMEPGPLVPQPGTVTTRPETETEKSAPKRMGHIPSSDHTDVALRAKL
jgi:hypothetical protein